VARDYNINERGACQCKKFWDAVGKSFGVGYTPQVYEVYGRSKSVTAILDAIIKDKQAKIARF